MLMVMVKYVDVKIRKCMLKGMDVYYVGIFGGIVGGVRMGNVWNVRGKRKWKLMGDVFVVMVAIVAMGYVLSVVLRGVVTA